MLYIEYKSKVLLKYKEERNTKNLSPLLMHPTRSNLRAECANLCQERFEKKDQEILRAFFGPHDNQKSYLRTITTFDADKFRPLLNFITEKTVEPELKNIELLAWMIDFTPRPFDCHDTDPPSELIVVDSEKTVSDVTGNLNTEIKINETVVVTNEQATALRKQQTPVKRRYILFAGLIFFMIAAMIYWLFRKPLQNNCMYWTGDRYEAVACDKKIEGGLVIAADSDKLQHFEKITRPDTITLKAIGCVWYSKIDNKIEFFTADGYHPVHPEYHLKPITKYMIEKYVVVQQKDSMTTMR